jgi:hypothetical protein
VGRPKKTPSPPRGKLYHSLSDLHCGRLPLQALPKGQALARDVPPLLKRHLHLVTQAASNQRSTIVPELNMKLKECLGGLSPEEIQQLEEETELRLHTCAVCGRRNLYAIRDGLGKWVPEPHNEPLPRMKHAPESDKL